MNHFKIILSILLFLNAGALVAQIDAKEMGKLYFRQAQNEYELGAFENTLYFIAKIEDCLCLTNATLLDLKIKTYYHLGRYGAAMWAFEQYEKYYLGTVSEKLEKETLSYYALIQKGLNDSIVKATEEQRRKNEENMEKLRLQKIIDAFQLVTCERCEGEGQYSLWSLLEKGKKPWWRKERMIMCEVCNGEGSHLIYSKNDSIMGKTEEAFIKTYHKEIMKRFPKQRNTE